MRAPLLIAIVLLVGVVGCAAGCGEGDEPSSPPDQGLAPRVAAALEPGARAPVALPPPSADPPTLRGLPPPAGSPAPAPAGP